MANDEFARHLGELLSNLSIDPLMIETETSAAEFAWIWNSCKAGLCELALECSSGFEVPTLAA